MAAAPQQKPAAPGNANGGKQPVSLDPVKANWEPIQAQNTSKLARLQLDNKPVLYIKTEQPNSVAAWKAEVVLRPGKYRFSGRAKASGLAAQNMRFGTGGGLRISGATRKNNLQGDKDWTNIQEDFDVQKDGPTRVFCELRANKGEIWFDLQSLKLERIQ